MVVQQLKDLSKELRHSFVGPKCTGLLMRLLRLILYAGNPGQVEQKCPVLGAEIQRRINQACLFI